MNKASSIWMGRMHFGALQPLTDQVWSSFVVCFYFVPQSEEINSGLTDLTWFTSEGSPDPPYPFLSV